MRRAQITAAFAVATLSLAGLVPGVAASPRSGELHVTKECSEYSGLAGSFCTFIGSNIKAIDGDDRIVYTVAAGVGSLDTDVVIAGGPDGVASGHCTLVFASLPGRCTFSGGTGIFTHFRASVAVSLDSAGLWHWDGTYEFSPPG
jgi:hypothetical protein